MKQQLIPIILFIGLIGCESQNHTKTSIQPLVDSVKPATPTDSQRDSLWTLQQLEYRQMVLDIDSAVNDPTVYERLLIGIWQIGGRGFAAGWQDNYQIFPDGRFTFNHNQMDCAKRELSFSGRWQLNNSQVQLTITQRDIYVGGHYEESYASCGSDSSLEEAVLKTFRVDPPDTLRLRVDGMRVLVDSSSPSPFQITYFAFFDSVLYTRMRDDPADYQ